MSEALIDLAAFRHNLGVVRSRIPAATRVLAMIKANAYGHGILEIAREASRCGVDFFGVARLEEAAALRAAGFTERILLIELVRGERARSAFGLGLDVAVVSVDTALELDGIASTMPGAGRVHVEIETGMGRTGMALEGAVDGVERIAGLAHLELAGVFTHLATADDPDQSFAIRQLETFKSFLAALETRGVHVPLRHLANSGAILVLPGSHFDMVRPGIMLYGYPPNEKMAPGELRPVLSLVSEVTFLSTVDAGVSISYGRRFFTRERTTIATVMIGYGDGFSRQLTNSGEVLIRGGRYPVVGTVCMDLMMVNVGLGSGIQLGDRVTLIGSDGGESITAWDIARRIGTIPYEVTCLLTSRVPRHVTLT